MALRGFQLKDKDYSHLIVNPLVLEKSKKISHMRFGFYCFLNGDIFEAIGKGFLVNP